MVYSLSQISEIAINGLSDEHIEEIKRDNGEILIVPDFADDDTPNDKFSPDKHEELVCAARRFCDAGFSCELTLSLEDFFRFADGAEFEKKAKALGDLRVELRILPVCLSNITVAEVLTDEQCVLFKAATDVCRAAGLNCSFDAQRFSVEQTLSASKKLNSWRQELKTANVNGTPLSPFEKFMYAYDIVSQFPYKEVADGEDMDLSRKLIYVLNSDKIVCVGFSAIFVHILSSLGIACEMLFLDELEHRSGHATCIAYIQDEKYGIDGFFISDPTFGTPGAERDQNVYFAVIPISAAKKVYGNRPELDDLDWMKRMLFDRAYGGEPQLSEKPTIEEAQEYLKKLDEYYQLKAETITKEPSDDMVSEFTTALFHVALAKGMPEEQAQRFAVSRVQARYDGLV